MSRDFYDDLLMSADTIKDALTARNEIIEILNRDSFQFHQWSSNDSNILIDISETNNSTDVQMDKDMSSRILGILWNST